MDLSKFLSPALGSVLSLSLLKKANPVLKSFISYGTAAGYGADQILDFIRRKVEGGSYTEERNRLERGIREGTLRPDEKAAASEIERRERPVNILQKGASIGTGIGAGFLGSPGAEEEYLQEADASPGLSPSPSPIQKDLEKDIALQNEKSFDVSRVGEDFPQLLEAVKKLLGQGMDLSTAIARVRRSPFLSPLVKRIEDAGVDFMEYVQNALGHQGQMNKPSSNETSNFLQGLQELSERLKGLQ